MTIDELLERLREYSRESRERGTYFENLSRAFLMKDSLYSGQFTEVLKFGDWARKRGENIPEGDTGIDLVAKLRDEEGYAAIQCKFRSRDYRIALDDITNFLGASGKPAFTRRIFIDTTEKEWTKQALDTIKGQTIKVNRIGLKDLRKLSIDWSQFDWSAFEKGDELKQKKRKSLHNYQQEAIQKTEAGFKQADRGKLIMACGTGKTFTALKIAESVAGKGGRVLFLAPSLALIAQTVREWANDSDEEIGLRAFSVCSDEQVGRRLKDDIMGYEEHDLEVPATTNAQTLSAKASIEDSERMTVIFSTYQSIEVINKAQDLDLQDFDLIICDEAHRTSGARRVSEEERLFALVHEDKNVRGKKRLYMTATPRIYEGEARDQADREGVELCSMDDIDKYGEEFYRYGFGKAVKGKHLADYKVVVLAVDEALVSRSIQNRLSEANELQLDDATKIVGCYMALIKEGSKVISEQNLKEASKNEESQKSITKTNGTADEKPLEGRYDFGDDPESMRKVIAFCKNIKSSKLIESEFSKVVEEYKGKVPKFTDQTTCEVAHVDGNFNAKTRGELLDWLDRDEDTDLCKVLSNVRCLGEGVDVPSLDGIMFLHPRKSQIDIVQAVGRVMRTAKERGKKYGYVILPVAVKAGVPPEKALDDNDRYKVIWQVLNALRAHDDNFNAKINQLNLNEKNPWLEVVHIGIGEGGGEEPSEDDTKPIEPKIEPLTLAFDELTKNIRAQIVRKCGQRIYWKEWTKNIAKVAQQHIERINAILETDAQARAVFNKFLASIHKQLNDKVTKEDAVEMLAQHLITKPIFEVLFKDYDFVKQNPVSRMMEKIIKALEAKNISKEANQLQGLYEKIKESIEDIDNLEAKQIIIKELYENFFKVAFPKTAEKLGIIYTPDEVVDFINHSVNDILKKEFGESLGSKGVHIIDPFTGTGTFIYQLLRSGLIAPEELEYKYKKEIHANEIVLLAYYIAAINIEITYQTETKKPYTSFKKICLTDTFHMYEAKGVVRDQDWTEEDPEDNSEIRTRQKALDIKVIIGNPPYSTRQKRAGDDTQNLEYPELDAKIGASYAAKSEATSLIYLYDSYIRAIRWASDRLGNDGGIVGFVTNSGWITKSFADGMRKSLEEECNDIYILNLRGDIRKNRQNKANPTEGENIFGQGSQTGIAITFLVKNSNREQREGRVHYYDIGDNLNTQQKLSQLKKIKSVLTLMEQGSFEATACDKYNDWINHRDPNFENYIPIGIKKGSAKKKIFPNFALGVVTSRDAWCYNASSTALEGNVKKFIEAYEAERERLQSQIKAKTLTLKNIEKFLRNDPTKHKWSRGLKKNLIKNHKLSIQEGDFRLSNYRIFCKRWLYYSYELNEMIPRATELYPTASHTNRAIAISGVGARNSMSALMVDKMLEYGSLEGGAQHFPLHLYEKETAESKTEALMDEQVESVEHGYKKTDGITDYALKHFQDAYSSTKITKEDLFYYVYGILHHPDYRDRFANNLTRQLPHIPAVNKFDDFKKFSEAGRKLGDLHVNFETAELYPVQIEERGLDTLRFDDPKVFYRVNKMKFAKIKKSRKNDLTTVIYNDNIKITGIPLEAYNYIINGKSALEWVMDEHRVRIDTKGKSRIVSDANDYANETKDGPAYPLKLFQRIITVSLETQKIVASLPNLDID